MAGLQQAQPEQYSLGTIPVMNNDQIDALDAKKAKEAKPSKPKVDLEKLASYVIDQFLNARQHKEENGLIERMLANTRQRNGQYEADVLQKLQDAKGCSMFFNITASKCVDAKSWMQDVLAPTDGKPWSLSPTPVPSLPESIEAQVAAETQATAIEQGLDAFSDVEQIFNALYDQQVQAQYDRAKKVVKRMEREIEDQMVEGKMPDAFDDFIFHFTTQPTAFFKGPVVRNSKKLSWVDGKPVMKNQEHLSWCSPDPKDIYPAPNISHLDDGYVCEIVRMSNSELSKMKEASGWSAEAITAVLKDPPAIPPEEYSYGQAERADLENRETEESQGRPRDSLSGIEFWGEVPGSILKESKLSLGIKKSKKAELEAQTYYSVTILVFGHQVVRAIMNPNPTGKKPYYASSYERVPGSVWGKSLPEKISESQRAYNQARRSAIDNIALSSGPMAMIDHMALRGESNTTTISPRQIFFFNGLKITRSGAKAVEFFQPRSTYQDTSAAAAESKNESDDSSGIPRFAHGQDGIGGAGDTSSGLAMLMNNAAKGIKSLLFTIDKDVVRPNVEACYIWNMLYNPKENIKGDAQVKPQGIMATIVKEQEQMRQKEFLNETNNDLDFQIMGLKRRAKVLKATADRIGLHDAVPSEEEMEFIEQQQAMMPEEGNPDEQPKN